jgi:hypothetical protein
MHICYAKSLDLILAWKVALKLGRAWESRIWIDGSEARLF